MKTIIFYISMHHGNTKKVAQTMGETLRADLVSLAHKENLVNDVSKYDLIGLGTGIYQFGISPKLYELVKQIDLKGKKVFLFSTSLSGVTAWHKNLKARLAEKGAIFAGEFVCPGFIHWAFFKWFGGGLRKGRPNATDLANARKFAESLKK